MRKVFIMDLVIMIIFSEESAIPMIADEDAVDHIPKNPPQQDRSHGCAYGTAART